MTQAKPTPGPWIVDEITEGGFVSNGTADICYQPFEKSTHGYNNWSANAAIIAEAGTVYHETHLTPRQLLAERSENMAKLAEAIQQRDALLELVKYAEEMMNPFLIWDDRDKTTWRKDARAAIAAAKTSKEGV